MDARTSRRQKRLSKKQEDRVAQDVGGRTQANSGATRMGGGGDVRGSELRIECKYTEKDSYSLKHDELEKVRKQAIKTLEQPVFQFAFRVLSRFEYYVVIPWGGEWKDPYVLDTAAKSQLLERRYLQTVLLNERQRLCVTFRKGAVGFQYEVLRWDDYLERQGLTNA